MAESADKVLRLKEAIRKVQSGEATVRAASQEFKIPRSTLHDKIKMKSSIMPSYKTELSPEEEDGLKKWIIGMADRGFGRNKQSILKQVKKILDGQGRTTRFPDNLPGKDWYYGFLRRHPELTNRSPLQLSKQRAMVTPHACQSWSSDFKDFMDKEVKDEEIWNEPQRWFNADESGFPLCPKSGKVVCSKEASRVYNFTTSDKNVITVMACLAADGSYVQPMIVFAGTRFNYNPLDGFDDAAFGRSPSGWMDSELFYSWLTNVFVPHITKHNLKRPVILFVDGHRTHLTMEASDVCITNGIVLYCLLENASHLMQPCDLRLFGSLKTSYRKAVSDFQDENPGDVVTKKTFARVFKKAWEEAAKPELAIGGFRDAGLFPFDPSKVAQSTKLQPAKLFHPEKAHPPKSPSNSSSALSQPNQPKALKVFRSTSSLEALDLATPRLRNPICTCPCTCEASSSTNQQKPQATTSFQEIPLPEAKVSKAARKKEEKMPKAATGPVFRELLQAKKQRKEDELKAKEERKRAREEKKRMLEEEKNKKRAEKAAKKAKKQQFVERMTQEMEASDDEMQIGPIDSNKCFKCEGQFHVSAASQWIGCDNCPRWFHRTCTDVDFTGLSEEDIQGLPFECLFC